MVVGPGRGRRAPSRHHARRGPSRSPTPNPTTARSAPRAAGSSTPTVRWSAPDWSGTTRPRHGLWQLDPDIAYLSGERLPTASGASRCSTSSASAKAAAPGACGARCGRRRDPGARRRRRPRRTAAAAASCVGRSGVGGDHPHRRPARQAGRRHTFADRRVDEVCCRLYCGVGGDRCRSRSRRISSMRIPTSVLAATAAVVVGFSQRGHRGTGFGRTAEVRGSQGRPRRRQNCRDPSKPMPDTPEHHLPGRLSRRAGRVRLRQADPRRIRQRGEVARLAHHALRSSRSPRPSTTRRSRPAARSAWCSRSTRTSAAPHRRPSTRRSTGIRPFAGPSCRSPVERPAAVPAGRQPVADHLPAGQADLEKQLGQPSRRSRRRSG